VCHLPIRTPATIIATIAVCCAAGFWALGYAVLANQHPHEDAYILFRYAEHIASGNGIVFNVGGPPSEGATDFLWLLGIAALTRLGVDVAFAAVALNSIGAGMLGALFAFSARPAFGRPEGLVLALLVPAIVIGSSAAAASAVGFSALLFSSFCAALFVITISESAWAHSIIPIIGLILGLIRPEGVAVGVAFTMVGGWLAWQGGQRQKYLVISALSGLAGIAYFAWRVNYFGLLLPLPLYVKGSGRSVSILPGLASSLQWLTLRISPVPALVLTLVFGLLARLERTHVVRLFLGLVPMAALFFVLTAAAPLQNINWRFQAPIGVVVVLALVHVCAIMIARSASRAARAVALVMLVFVVGLFIDRGSRLAIALYQRIPPADYLDTFAPVIGGYLTKNDVIATNELGRLSYWTEAQVEDMSGLTNPTLALRPPRVEDLRLIDPDILIFHHGGTLEVERVIETPERVAAITSAELDRIVGARVRHIYDEGALSYRDSRLNTLEVAPPVMTRYLVDSKKYDTFLVDFRGHGAYEHVYAFREGWPYRERAIAELRASFDRTRYQSYLAIRRRQGSDRAH